jgi:hypothetical protein
MCPQPRDLTYTYNILANKWDHLGARYLIELESEKEKVGVGNNFLAYIYIHHSLFVVCIKTTNESVKTSKQVTHSCMVGTVGDFALWKLNMISLFLTQ